MVLSRDFAVKAALAGSALLSSAVLFYYGTGETPLWWAPWCAALIVLLAAPRLPAPVAFGMAASAWFLGSLNMLRYTYNILATAPDAAVSVAIAIVLSMIVPACVFGLAALLFRGCVRRGLLWQGALCFASAWVTFEYITSVTSPHGTFGNLGYSEMNVLPLLQLASVTGIWGISFCVFLLPAAVAALFAGAGDARQKSMLVFGVGGFFAVVLAFGFWRLEPVPNARPDASIEVGLIASDLPENLTISDPGRDTNRKLQDYADHAATLVLHGAQIVVLPEKLGVEIPATIGADDALLQNFADHNRARIIAGLIRKDGPDLLNEARIYTPAHAPLTYDKQHMLPAFESRLKSGTTRTLMRGAAGLLGVAVCKDMDFPTLSRQYGNDGIGLLLVPAWDFGDDNWLHDRMAVMRGVESGFTIARAAKEGLLTVSDDRGRVLAQQTSKAAPFASLLASAPVRHDDTPYARFGDWFAWLALAMLAAIIANVRFGRRR